MDLTTARVLRLARFVRLLRLVRAIRAFHSLRVVVLGIIDSMTSLCWCFVVVGFIIYTFAVFFLHAATEHIEFAQAKSPDNTDTSTLRDMFGGMQQSMMTLFMSISGGLDWGDVLGPLEAMHWFYVP